MSTLKFASPYADKRVFAVAQLRTISFAKLIARDAQEQSKLLAAAEQDGFWYLGLTDPESKGLWNDYINVLKVMGIWFDQPVESKVPFAYGSDTQGYCIFPPD